MRILEHTISNDKLFNFWNFFSAFEVPGEERDRDEIEAILIASMPTANSSNPKFQPIPLPKQVSAALAERRRIDVEHPRLQTTKQGVDALMRRLSHVSSSRRFSRDEMNGR